MHPLVAKAAAIVLALPKAWFPDGERPETPIEREQRIVGFVTEVIAAAEDIAPKAGYEVDEIAALSLTFAYSESAFAWEVHAGQPWPGRPPPLGDRGRARCLFQLQRSAALVPRDEWRPFEPDEWRRLSGLDHAATRFCAQAGVRAVGWHALRCKHKVDRARSVGDHSWVGMVLASQYHRPDARCENLSRGSGRRGDLYKHLLYRLRKPGGK